MQEQQFQQHPYFVDFEPVDNSGGGSKPEEHKIFRLNMWIVIAILYLTLCFAHAYTFRGQIMLVSQQMTALLGVSIPGFRAGIWIYLFAGISPLLMFELVVWFITRSFRMRFPTLDVGRAKHILRYFYAGASLIIGLVRLSYFIFPLYIVIIKAIVPFVIYTACFVGCYFYVRRIYVGREHWGRLLQATVMPYLVLVGALTVMNVFMVMM